ncbi:cytochrome P450 [Streptomyces sp. 7-21]|uniref:cytochrome P450 n=1 Tax=Streptomyces sp. 7-21 TaxID=2802283 RepID=UPI00191CE245|nr:cytochrome P450 [Streptomyces sp. 7-21]MBL1065225.1 cytochrome P450 [Streptomyces sp. 7-21]
MPTQPAGAGPRAGLPRASAADEALVATHVLLPALAGGLAQRRRGAMARAERRQADRPAIDTVRGLRDRYGPGPLRLRAGGRPMALLLDPGDLARVRRETPEPFAPAVAEQRRARARFRALAPAPAPGRRVTAAAPDPEPPPRQVALAVARRVHEEAGATLRQAAAAGALTWDGFAEGWWRAARRVVLGDAAAGDRALTDRLALLRNAGGWTVPRPAPRRARTEFLDRVRQRAAQAPPDSLAGAARQAGTDPVDLVPQWLSAFGTGGPVTLRALALLAASPQHAARVRGELALAGGLEGTGEPPFLRACVRESVRLWPPAPLLLRVSTRATAWRGALIPAGTVFAASIPYFHRDGPAGPAADAFVPEMWLDGRAAASPAFVPFGGGTGHCPGAHTVLLAAAAWLAALLAGHTFLLRPPVPLTPQAPVPVTLDHFALRFTVAPG